MRALCRTMIAHRRRLSVLPLIVLVLAGCCGGTGGGGEEASEDSMDTRLSKWEQSLRAEADWLWGNMQFVSTHLSPNEEHCAEQSFKHKSVGIDDSTRKTDPDAGTLVDQLDYAETLIVQARSQWRAFCNDETTSSTAYAFLQSRLTPAYDSLNYANSKLAERAEQADEG
ncbi:MAG: hypothetical protein JXJ20_09415 [Anaerolineae bacterium]|nr:hypothetical protein [Anaerolineae bacterium]